MRRGFPALLAIAWVMASLPVDAQVLTGALVGTVKDEQGAVLSGALVRVTSPSLIGGPATMITNERGQLRFPTLTPGTYSLDIELPGFPAYPEADIRMRAGAQLEREDVLKVTGLDESLVLKGIAARTRAGAAGFETAFGTESLKAIPWRSFSMFGAIRAAPGVSPTSP